MSSSKKEDDSSGGGVEGKDGGGPLLCKFIDSSGHDITRQLTQPTSRKKPQQPEAAKLDAVRRSRNSLSTAVDSSVGQKEAAVKVSDETEESWWALPQ